MLHLKVTERKVTVFGNVKCNIGISLGPNHKNVNFSKTFILKLNPVPKKLMTLFLWKIRKIHLDKAWATYFKIRSLFFSDIVHDDSRPWYLMTDETRFLKKKRANIRPKMRFFIILSLDHKLSFKLHMRIACTNA